MVDGVLYTKDMSRLVRYPNSDTRAALGASGPSAIPPSPQRLHQRFAVRYRNRYRQRSILPHAAISTMPASLTGIGDMAFDSCSAKLLVLPDNLATIGSMAFTGRYPMLLVVSPGSWAEQWAVSVNEPPALPGRASTGRRLPCSPWMPLEQPPSYPTRATRPTDGAGPFGQDNVRAIGQDAFAERTA